MTESKSGVLPLHHRPVEIVTRFECGAELLQVFRLCNKKTRGRMIFFSECFIEEDFFVVLGDDTDV